MSRDGYENNDFTGGLSDEYVPSKDNRLDAAENICLDDDLTPIQRPGSGKLMGSNSAFGKNGNQTEIKGLQENTKQLFAFNDNLAFAYDKTIGDSFVVQDPDSGTPDVALGSPKNFNQVSSPQTITTGAAAAALTGVSGGSVNSFQARDIVYATSSKLSYPQKFFRDEVNPSADSTCSVGLPILPEMFNPKSSANFTPILNNKLTLWKYTNSGSPSFIYSARSQVSAGVNPLVPTAGDTWGWSDKPYTYYAGLPVKTVWGFTYQVSFCLRHTYTIDGIKYVKRSPPTVPVYFLSDIELKTVYGGGGSFETHIIGIEYSLVDIFNLMREMNVRFLREGDVDDLIDDTSTDDSTTVLEVYMSDSGGTTLSTRKTFIPDATFGILETRNSYHATVNRNEDQALSLIFARHERDITDTDFTTLYTAGGILPYDPPPPCKYLFNAGTYAFYLNVKEQIITTSAAGDQNPPERTFTSVPYRLKISNANDPDSVPEGNIVDFPDELTGGGSVLDRAITGTIKEIYRIDGRFDSTGSGLVNAQLLSSETGILSHKSVVAVKDKLFFCGDDGIYVTDGVGVLCISRHISRTYRELIQAVASDSLGEIISINRETAQTEISAVYDRVYDRIIFSFGKYCLALELKASQLEAGYGSFYGPWFVGFNKPLANKHFAALGIFKDMVVRGDQYGYVTQMSPGYLSDPRVNTLVAPSTWGLWPIIYRLRTAKLAFGSLMVKKWVNYVTFMLKRRKVLSGGQSNIDVQVNAYNDGERVRQTLRPAHYTGARDEVFSENPKVAGFAVPKVITDTLVNFQRRFGSSGLRCITKAVEFTNGYHLVGKSDDSELALCNLQFASLPNYPTFTWPKETQDIDQVNYVIAFDTDDYATKYLVTAISGGTLTLDANPPAGSNKWKLYSVSSKQFFGLHSLGLVFTLFGSKHDTYALGDQGGNAGDAGE